MTINHFRPSYLIFFLALCVSNFIYAQPKISQSSQPSWVNSPPNLNLKQNPRDVSEGYYLKLYDYQIHAEEQTYFVHIVRDIISETGIQNGSEIWVSFAPEYQKLTFHEVSILRDGKTIQRLNLKDFKVIAQEQEAASFIYNGNYSAYLILDDIRVGDQIEYSYSLIGDNPVFKGKFFEDIYLQTDVPVSHLYTSILIDEKRHLAIKEFNGAKKPQRKKDKGMTHFIWEEQMVKPPKFETYTPLWHNNYRHVQLSEYKDWNEVADWAKSINTSPNTLKGDLLRKTKELLSESKGDKKIFAENAIRLIQDQIRYTGIEIGEYSHRANQPEKVYSQRYGDCKDKSLLLVSMLQHAGIEAYMSLMNTKSAQKLRDELPSPAAFNHAIVYFRINEKPYWVDPTISHQGGSLDSQSFPYRGSALVLSEEKDRIRGFGFNEEGNINCTETYTISLQDSTKATLSVQTVYTGWQADILRSQLAYNSILETENGYLDYYSRLYPLIELADSLTITDDKPSNRLIVEESYLISDFLIKDEQTKRYNVAFYANMINDQLPALSGNRENPVSINYPMDIDYTIRVISPYGWDIKPERFFVDRDSYLFGMNAKNEGNTLILNYQFKFHRPVVSVEKSSEFAADIRNITNNKLSYAVYLESAIVEKVDVFNWAGLFYTLFLVGTTSFAGFRIYRIRQQTVLNEDSSPVYYKMGGWLILALVGILTLVFIAVALMIK